MAVPRLAAGEVDAVGVRDLLAGADVAQGEVVACTIDPAHEAVRLAGVVDVVLRRGEQHLPAALEPVAVPLVLTEMLAKRVRRCHLAGLVADEDEVASVEVSRREDAGAVDRGLADGDVLGAPECHRASRAAA